MIFLSNHDQLKEAFDLFQMANMQSKISSYDQQIQVHYNRAIVCIGTAMFRQGKFYDAFKTLKDICSCTNPIDRRTNSLKDLLRQNIDKNKQENRRKMIP